MNAKKVFVCLNFTRRYRMLNRGGFCEGMARNFISIVKMINIFFIFCFFLIIIIIVGQTAV